MTIINELRKKYHKYQEVHKDDFDPETQCVTCKRPLNIRNSIAIKGKLRRHEGCEAGSPQWLKHRKDSQLYDLFVPGDKI